MSHEHCVYRFSSEAWPRSTCSSGLGTVQSWAKIKEARQAKYFGSDYFNEE